MSKMDFRHFDEKHHPPVLKRKIENDLFAIFNFSFYFALVPRILILGYLLYKE